MFVNFAAKFHAQTCTLKREYIYKSYVPLYTYYYRKTSLFIIYIIKIFLKKATHFIKPAKSVSVFNQIIRDISCKNCKYYKILVL